MPSVRIIKRFSCYRGGLEREHLVTFDVGTMVADASDDEAADWVRKELAEHASAVPRFADRDPADT